MPTKKSRNKRQLHIDIIKTIVLNFIIYTAVFSLLCIICNSTDINIRYMSCISFVFIAVASFISGFVTGITKRKNGLMTAFLTALPFNVFFIIISAFMNSFSFDYNILISLTVGGLLSALGGIISVNVRLG
ncbi:MAG: TIGR04086 family membrane protein [Clostridia bacterium]|nr:TIGR04086 family membrane protein [Clostridia bacterium]